MFGKSKEKWLKKYIQLENGVPDACTFRNVVKAIDTQQLHTVFIEWMKEAVESISGVVVVDGKQARRTKDAKKRALHVVSAFSAECGLVLGQLACEEKSNEITAIPKLLEQLELKGCIVTIDAMGTQSEIASAITNKGADYILSLKENQPGLYRCEDISWLEGREKWSNLQGIGVVFSETEENGKKSKQAHYFIYSCKGMTAAQILEAKRSHWGIENKLHWGLDMQFREDESRARADNSAENLNVLRHWAYNLVILALALHKIRRL